jgi:hypothetical protein
MDVHKARGHDAPGSIDGRPRFRALQLTQLRYAAVLDRDVSPESGGTAPIYDLCISDQEIQHRSVPRVARPPAG